VLAITGNLDYSPLGTACAQLYLHFPNTMATKKNASKTTESTPASPEEISKPVAKKAAKKAVAKKAPAKKAAPAAAEKAAPAPAKKAPAKKAAAKPSLDVIARAAYLNYRRRVELGLPGDSHGDWLEAERQFSESK
jgi:hypothetical protein